MGKLGDFVKSTNLYKNYIYKYEFKHNFVIASIFGSVLVGSINANLRVWGFIFCTIGNIYWIWHHKNVTCDKETMWIFISYLIINTFAIVNNYCGGCLQL